MYLHAITHRVGWGRRKRKRRRRRRRRKVVCQSPGERAFYLCKEKLHQQSDQQVSLWWGQNNTPTQHHILANKNFRTRMGYLFLSLSISLKHYRLLLLPLVSFYNFTVRLLLKIPHRAWRNQAGTDLEVSSLLTRSYSAGKCYACCPRSNAIISPTQLRILWATIMTGVGRHAHWCDSGSHSIGVTNHFLIGSMACPMRWKPCMLIGPRTYGLWVVGPKGEPNTIILLNDSWWLSTIVID